LSYAALPHLSHLKIPRLLSILRLFSKQVSFPILWLIVPKINSRGLAGRLEEALAQYKRSKQFGVDRAAMHIRNVNFFPPTRLSRSSISMPKVSAKILGQKLSTKSNTPKPDL
jgi:hypothetical protein